MINGVSLEAQIEKCLAYAKAHGLVLGPESNCGRGGVFSDGGVSSTECKSIGDRPGGAMMLEVLQKGDLLICTSPHRLFRNLFAMLRQLDDWSKRGVNVVFTDMNLDLTSPVGKLQMHILGAIAEFRVQLLAKRIEEGRAWKKKNNEDVPDRAENYFRKVIMAGIQVSKSREHKPNTMDLIGATLIENRLNPTVKKPEGTIRIYVRVSKAMQDLESQEHQLQQWVDTAPDIKGLPVVWYRDQGKSAYSTPLEKRPAGKTLLAESKPGDLIVVLRTDRIFRSLKDMTEVVSGLNKRGVGLYIMESGIRTDNKFGSMIVEMLGWAAQIESYETDVSSNTARAYSVRMNGLNPNHIPVFLKRGSLTPQTQVKSRGGFHLGSFLKPEEADWFNQNWLRGMAERVQPDGSLKGHFKFTRELTNELFDRIGIPPLRRNKIGGFDSFIRPISSVLQDMDDMDAAEQGDEFAERRSRREEIRRELKEHLARRGDILVWEGIIRFDYVHKNWALAQRWANALKQEGVLTAAGGTGGLKGVENLQVLLSR